MLRCRTLSLLVALAAAATVAGCAPKLGKNIAAAIIREYDRHHCRSTVIYKNDDFMPFAGNPFADESAKVQDWMGTVLGPPRYPAKNAQTNFGCVSHAEYVSAEDGWTVSFDGCLSHTAGSRTQLETCVRIPEKVTILDVSYPTRDRKQVVVTYRSTFEPTVFVKDLLKAKPGSGAPIGIPHAVPDALSMAPGEYRATLTKLDATGWRVDATSFFEPGDEGDWRAVGEQ